MSSTQYTQPTSYEIKTICREPASFKVLVDFDETSPFWRELTRQFIQRTRLVCLISAKAKMVSSEKAS